jgi:cytochrome P450
VSATTGLEGIDLTDLDLFADGFPHHLFEIHRREAPVWWHEPTEHTPDGEGFWSVATYAETLQVQRDPVAYSSERGGGRKGGGTFLADLDVAGLVLSMMDDPRHARIRRLVSTGLTPRRVAALEDDLRQRTRRLLAGVEDGSTIDFASDIAAELPIQVICSLLGIPEEDREQLEGALSPAFDVREGDAGVGLSDPARMATAHRYAAELLEAKRARPADDMLSVVVHAALDDVEPSSLSDLELLSFFFLLFSAGSDTTRNAIAGGLHELTRQPDQLAALRRQPDLMTTAIEEIVRWTAPSPAKRRTATGRTELRGHTIEPGDKVLFWEASANRDELAFADPMRFDIRRDPNPHLSFGHGVHYCLGANLARLEIRVMLTELLATFRTFEVVAPPEWTRSNRHTGIRHLPMRLARGD